MKIENDFRESAPADTATQTRRRRLAVATATLAAGASMVALAGCSNSKSPDNLQETPAPLPPFATSVAPLASPSTTQSEASPTGTLSPVAPTYLESMSSTLRPTTSPESTPSFTSCFWTEANKQLIGEVNGLLGGPVPGASLTRGCDERDRPANIPANGFYTFEGPTLTARADIFDDLASPDNPLSRKIGFCTVNNAWIKIVVDHGAPVPNSTPEFVPAAEFGVLEFPPEIPPVPCK